MKTTAFAAFDPESPLKSHTIERRKTGLTDLQVEVLYCGVCHSDIHQARNEWGGTVYPIVPGHEIIGRITETGSQVTTFKTGDYIGIGCFVDSCRHCNPCKEGEENFCEGQITWTYNSMGPGETLPTYGGYSKQIVVDEKYALRINPEMELHKAAPLLCAGITTYSPLKHWKAGKGTRLAVLGLGGLGHMAVKFGVAFGCEVTVLSSGDLKKQDALELGAHRYINHTRTEETDTVKNYFDLILDTVSAPHDLNFFMTLLRRDSTLVLVGIPSEMVPFSHRSVISKRKSISGSSIGGTRETQEMLDFCAENGIYPEVEMIRLDEINTAYERMIKNDIKYRFVIDMSKS